MGRSGGGDSGGSSSGGRSHGGGEHKALPLSAGLLHLGLHLAIECLPRIAMWLWHKKAMQAQNNALQTEEVIETFVDVVDED